MYCIKKKNILLKIIYYFYYEMDYTYYQQITNNILVSYELVYKLTESNFESILEPFIYLYI